MPYCDRCDRSFRSWPALQQHLDNSSNHHICDNCDLDFSTDWALTQHYVQSPHHHYCQRCDEDFDDDEDLKTHYEDEHHYCGICEKVSLSQFLCYAIVNDPSTDLQFGKGSTRTQSPEALVLRILQTGFPEPEQSQLSPPLIYP